MAQLREYSLKLDFANSFVDAVLRNAKGEVLGQGSTPVDLANLTLSVYDLTSDSCQEVGQLIGEVIAPEAVRVPLIDAILAGPLRLKLYVTDALSGVPWESLWLKESSIGFVAQHPTVRISRTAGEGIAPESAPRETIKVLLVTADPQSTRYGTLAAVGQELQSVAHALSSPECRGVTVHTHEHATPNSLGRELKDASFDVFHYIGHGDLKPTGGVLVLEGTQPNEEAAMYGDELSNLLMKAGTRLVVLSACVTTGISASIGEQLARAGIQAVVGMQLPIADVDALLFARALYSALTSGFTIEESVYQARMAIRGTGCDWIAPVLITSHPGMKLVTRAEKDGERAIRGNLPRPPTSFIGRQKEIFEVGKALEKERLVILLGSGGIGKTRLSIEVGRAVAPKFAHGVWQVLLDPIAENARVVETIARVFGIRDSSKQSIDERLFEFLRSQELLILLDNCEHVADGCRDVARRILDECPSVSILATSRVVLKTGAESVVNMPALSFPIVPREDVPVYPVEETISAYEALQLLQIRGKAANSNFKVTEKNIEDLCRIAQRLDGIPLALELAASRMLTFTPKQVLEKLSKDLAWLDQENPGKVPRHKTLRATIDWSYRLLSDKEKLLFARLGAFAGTFSLEAAEAVCGLPPLSSPEVGDLLNALVEQSLVVAEEHEHEMRYRLLDTCRAFACAVLEKSGELAAMRDRQLTFTASLVGKLLEIVKGGDVSKWLTMMGAEHDNIALAIDWGISENRNPHLAGEITADSIWYWLQVGLNREAARTADRVLATLPDEEEVLRIKLMLQGGSMKVFAGEHGGIEMMKAAHDMAALRHPDLLRNAKLQLSHCAYDVGDEDLALELFEWILEDAKAAGQPAREGDVRLSMAYIEINRGNLDLADGHLQTLLERKEQTGDSLGIGLVRCALGYLDSLRDGGKASELFITGLDELHAAKHFLGLQGSLLIASYLLAPETAASVQGFADRMVEESGCLPERITNLWADDTKAKTKEQLGAAYERCYSDGRTMGLDEVMTHFRGLSRDVARKR